MKWTRFPLFCLLLAGLSAVCEILLVSQTLIGGEKHVEHLLISKPKQITVPGTTPTLLVNCRDCMRA